MLVIPAIDLKEGKCVRLRQGKMDESTIFSDDPLVIAKKWADQGARRLHLVDLDGAFEGKPHNQLIIKSICSQITTLPIQVGGGIRDLDTIEAYLQAGVSWVIIGTQAVKDPDFVKAACKAFPGKVIVGVDAKAGRVATEGWAEVSEIDAVDLVKSLESTGVSSVVYTDIARDGMMKGVNFQETAALAEQVNIPIIASGGVTDLSDIQALADVSRKGISGVIVGRAIYEETLDLFEAQTLADKLSKPVSA